MNCRGSIILFVIALAVVSLAGCGSSPNPEVQLGGISLIDYLDGVMARTQRALGTVVDGATAQKAADELKLINQDLDDLVFHAPKLSSEGKEIFRKEVAKRLIEIKDMRGFISNNRGLEGVLGEQMQAMVEKMESLLSL